MRLAATRRDLTLFNTALATMLGASDLLALKLDDVTDREGNLLGDVTVWRKIPVLL